MLFWILAALLTFAACMAVLVPMARGSASPVSAEEHDIEVYRDQLDEIGRDAARGLIGKGEASEARAEIGRRILSLSRARARAAPTGPGAQTWRWTALVIMLLIAAVSWGLYGAIGSPGLAGQPLRLRLAAEPAETRIEDLVRQAEAHLAANPSDGRGWDVLAPIYMRTGRYVEAETAHRNAIRLIGASAEREAGLGEAIAARAGGVVNADAQAAFERALALQPDQPKARFFLATALAQDGRMAEAQAGWQALLEQLPSGSPWRDPVERALKEVRGPVAEEGVRSPAATDTAPQMPSSAQERAAMIEAMVASLDRRLENDPSDMDGWQRLIRSYSVLGRPGAARDALDRAVAAFGQASTEARALREFAAQFGLAAQE